MSTIKLYFNPLSGHAHRPWAMLKLLNIEFEEVLLDFFKGEHKTPEFLKINPLGQLPVMVDGDTVLRDSTAALVYLALQYDPSRQWLPVDPIRAAEVQQWLAISTREVFEGPGTARMIKIFNVPRDYDEAVKKTDHLFTSLFEARLKDNDWLVGDHPTIADVSNYGYIAAVTEGDVDLKAYPNIYAWVKRLEDYPNFTSMPPAAPYLPK
ncbi:glutathione S-transferase family protein [Agarilytica rhodophyticola]|uniref:glutathione S-transferase family protein n=1 Tax=Agarilytica rhodophyticola TaxID=1737490 RepID=UPI000B34A0B0|nr:glutathione S-transferase family protein [Agarilytica rhodophyticola]